jgi:hypothetical protein
MKILRFEFCYFRNDRTPRWNGRPRDGFGAPRSVSHRQFLGRASFRSILDFGSAAVPHDWFNKLSYQGLTIIFTTLVLIYGRAAIVPSR